MKTQVFTFILLVLSGNSFLSAQTTLPDSQRNSSELYVYKATIEDLRQIYLKDKNPDENMLQSFVTSYARNEEIPPLPRGNYFVAGADGNHLVFSDHTVDDFNFKIIPGEQMKLCLYDSLGNIIRNAEVKCGSSQLKFDITTQTYNANNVKDGQIIEIMNKGVAHYIEIEKDKSTRYYSSNNNAFKKSWRIVKHKWFNLKQSIIGFFNPAEREIKDKYTGFIVFNKPKYKPGETVKLKAYMTGYNDKLYNKPVGIRLYNYGRYKMDTILIRNLAPYRPGMYQYEFKLSDSLNLKLDNNYTIALKINDINKNELSNNFRY